MTDRDDILFLLGEIKGQLTGFTLGQAAQDSRMTTNEALSDARFNRLEETQAALMWKVAGIVGLLEALGIGAMHFVKG